MHRSVEFLSHDSCPVLSIKKEILLWLFKLFPGGFLRKAIVFLLHKDTVLLKHYNRTQLLCAATNDATKRRFTWHQNKHVLWTNIACNSPGLVALQTNQSSVSIAENQKDQSVGDKNKQTNKLLQNIPYLQNTATNTT